MTRKVDTERTWTVENWSTVAVAVLPPGWRNVYRGCNGESPSAEPCPALLLQELRETVHYRDVRPSECFSVPFRPEKTTERHQAPYRTRVVFADRGNCGCLIAAGDWSEGYRGTVGPEEDLERATELAVGPFYVVSCPGSDVPELADNSN